jgi:hypothetical protein
VRRVYYLVWVKNNARGPTVFASNRVYSTGMDLILAVTGILFRYRVYCPVWKVRLWVVPRLWVSEMAERSCVSVWRSEFALDFLISFWNGRTKAHLRHAKSSFSRCKDEWSGFNPEFHCFCIASLLCDFQLFQAPSILKQTKQEIFVTLYYCMWVIRY